MVGEALLYLCNHIPMDIHTSSGILYLDNYMLAYWKIHYSELNYIASLWFLALFVYVFTTSILDMRWSGVAIDDWWRNKQF